MEKQLIDHNQKTASASVVLPLVVIVLQILPDGMFAPPIDAHK